MRHCARGPVAVQIYGICLPFSILSGFSPRRRILTGRSKRKILQRQLGITGGEDRREENRDPLQIQPMQHQQKLHQQVHEFSKCDMKMEFKGEGEKMAELIVPDTMALGGGTVTLTTTQPTLLQVPPMMVIPRDTLGPGPLPKQHSHPTPLLATTPLISKQLSHPEGRGPPTHHGPPPMTKQRSHPSVLTHTPPHTLERISSTTNITTTTTTAGAQHLQVIPMQVFVKQRPSPTTITSQSSQLRPIQPKPSTVDSQTSDSTPKKDVPLIRLTPSEDGGNVNISSSSSYNMSGCGMTGPPRLPRAVSEEPAMTRPSMTHTPELLQPGPSVLVQSVSQDSGLDIGMGSRMLSAPSLAVNAPMPDRSTSSPGHCPVLRGGPALGCNFCWNSTDPQGRVLRRKTKYHCPECRTNLCIVPCFHEYHKQMERAQDTDKQITKILTKTGSM